jgi:hypothetical protein
MNAAICQIQDRQRGLIAQSESQRRTFAQAWQGIERPLLRGKAAAHRMSNPWIWAGIALVAFKLPIRKFSRIPTLLWKGWKLARKVHAIVR